MLPGSCMRDTTNGPTLASLLPWRTCIGKPGFFAVWSSRCSVVFASFLTTAVYALETTKRTEVVQAVVGIDATQTREGVQAGERSGHRRNWSRVAGRATAVMGRQVLRVTRGQDGAVGVPRPVAQQGRGASRSSGTEAALAVPCTGPGGAAQCVLAKPRQTEPVVTRVRTFFRRSPGFLVLDGWPERVD